MKNEKNDFSEKERGGKNSDAQKIVKILLAVFGGLAQKLSVSLVLNAKKQVDEIINSIKRGILAGFFALLGVFFLLVGLAFYLESIYRAFSGIGFLIVGGSAILLAILITLLKK